MKTQFQMSLKASIYYFLKEPHKISFVGLKNYKVLRLNEEFAI